MAGTGNSKSTKKLSGSRIAALLILVLVIAAVSGYFVLGKRGASQQKPETAHDSLIVPRPTAPPDVVQTPPDEIPPPHKKKSDYPPTDIVPDGDKPGVAEGDSGRLAIIIDDMGNSMSEARSLAAIKVPLTFAIIPGLRVDTEVAEFAALHGIESMIHIPMQPKGWPAQHLEASGLLVEMADADIQERVSGFVQHLPKAVGANNHMGSEFTEHEEKMTAVLQSLQKHNLFFIDSVTSAGSVGSKIAQRLGVRTARRHVFLDNELNRGYIIGQLNQAVRIAKKNGSAIAICHPHPATIAALAAALPGLAGQGVSLVPASQLVR